MRPWQRSCFLRPGRLRMWEPVVDGLAPAEVSKRQCQPTRSKEFGTVDKWSNLLLRILHMPQLVSNTDPSNA